MAGLRTGILMVFCFAAAALPGQLRVQPVAETAFASGFTTYFASQYFMLGAAAGARLGLRSKASPSTSLLRQRSLEPAGSPSAPAFDFTRTAPHLAFFCRLEINEKAGAVIPAKFRLGGHTYWQDALWRRE